MATRNQAVKTAIKYLGAKQGSKRHKKLVDTFNKVRPHGEKGNYTCAWCAIAWTAWQILIGMTAKETPMSYNCGTLIADAKKLGIWVEDDNYLPKKGDGIIYDWSDTGYPKENKDGASHVGMVVKVSGNSIKVIEGNYSTLQKVAYRTIKRNQIYIRGWITPKYDTNSKLVKKMKKFAKKYADDNSYKYRKWSESNKYTHQCPLCHPKSNEHATKGWNCRGYVAAILYHGGGIKSVECSCKGLGLLGKKLKDFTLANWKKYNGNNWKRIYNDGKNLKLSQLKDGDVIFYFNSDNSMKHVAFVYDVKNGKIADSTSSNGIKIRKPSTYGKVAFRYTGE